MKQLSQAQLKEFDEKGFLFFPSLFDASEIDSLTSQLEDLLVEKLDLTDSNHRIERDTHKYRINKYKQEYNQSDSEEWQRYELGWIEYKALFHNGSLISIDLAKNEKPIELNDEELYNKRERIAELRKKFKK